MPRGEEEERRAEQLLLTEPVAVLLGLDEGRQEIVAQRPAPPLDEANEIFKEGIAGRLDAHLLVGRDERIGIDARRELGRPGRKRRVVLRWNAQELADDHDRERVREVGHDVHPTVAAGFDLVEPLVDDLLDADPEPLDHLRRERLAHEAT